MDTKNWIIVVLSIIAAVAIAGSLVMRELNKRDTTISILNYHLAQLQKQPMEIK
jgi:hypothetical protein